MRLFISYVHFALQFSVWLRKEFQIYIFAVLSDLLFLLKASFLSNIVTFQAGLVTTLNTRTIVFGATNPKGQYDPEECIASFLAFYFRVKCEKPREHYIMLPPRPNFDVLQEPT